MDLQERNQEYLSIPTRWKSAEITPKSIPKHLKTNEPMKISDETDEKHTLRKTLGRRNISTLKPMKK